MKRPQRWQLAALFLVASLGAASWWFAQSRNDSSPASLPFLLPQPAERSQWPWADAKSDKPHRGVGHWLAKQKDGTTVDLLSFDFKENPDLRFELYDQDEDDAKPFDNVVDYWPLGVGQATGKLNARFGQQKNGRIVAAWNGLFFGYYRKMKVTRRGAIPERAGHHVSPVVLRGRVLYNTANHRWTFGVKYANGRPTWKTQHLASRAWMQRELDFGGGSAQCLIRNGQALRLKPFPRTRREVRKQPIASTPQEIGHVPIFDHMKTCRVSMAWSKDNRYFYVLVVKEPDSEGASAIAFLQNLPASGGWTVPDVQKFWLNFSRTRAIEGAVNIDAGGVAQLTYLRPDNRYEMIPGQEASSAMRLIPKRNFSDAPRGGSIMYFYVRDRSLKTLSKSP